MLFYCAFYFYIHKNERMHKKLNLDINNVIRILKLIKYNAYGYLNVSQDAMYDVRIEFTLKNLCIISYFSVQNYGNLNKSKNIFKKRI